MSPKLIRSALLTLCQALSLAACSTAPATKYHLVPEPSPGAMIATAPAAPAASATSAMTAASSALRTGLSIDRSMPARSATRLDART